MAFEKGDVIWVIPEKRNTLKLKHPSVIWDDLVEEEAEFQGIMLSHAEPSGRFENLPMSYEHFETGHEVGFSNTHFVNQIFIKFQEWGPFYRAGKLTAKGIEYIESKLSHNAPMSFEDYK